MKRVLYLFFILVITSCFRDELHLVSCDSLTPDCLNAVIEKIKNDSVWSPPAKIYRYTYNGKKVYFIPSHCCDIPSVLLDESCNPLCSPDGGIAGVGDGKCADFFDKRKDQELVWEDKRN